MRSHMDDLNSENAKLNAELIQYRGPEPSVVVKERLSAKAAP